MSVDIPLTVIGGRGPHGLALHLWMQDRNLGGYTLLDPAPNWLPLYGPDGPMRAVKGLRSPREFDFSLGDPERRMGAYRENGATPLANVYSLDDAEKRDFGDNTTDADRADRLTFWRYANSVAAQSGADERLRRDRVVRLEPCGDHWRVYCERGDAFTTRVVVLATGLAQHVYVPRSWRFWWQQLPAACAHHALRYDYPDSLRGKRVAVLGSSNSTSWEAALLAAERGARVTLLSRAPNPIEWQLPVPAQFLRPSFVASFVARPAKERLRWLKKTPIPASALPGSAAKADTLGVRVRHFARIRYAAPLWGGVQVQYRTPDDDVAEHFDLVIAATGVSPRLRALPLIAEAAQQSRAPIVTSGPARYRPILDDAGRWKTLPPLYPLGAYALARAGLIANSLGSATVYLPLVMPAILRDARITSGPITTRSVATPPTPDHALAAPRHPFSTGVPHV